MHISRLDLLRGVAILLVYLYHAQLELFKGFQLKSFDPDGLLVHESLEELLLNLSPVAFGWSGVHLFLLISGFLIHRGFLIGLDKGKGFLLGTFVSKRFWRIYPPYIIAFLAFFLISGRDLPFTQGRLIDLISHALMVHNLNDRTILSINPSFWSIALEVQLYAVYPLLLLMRHHLDLERALKTLLLLGGALILAEQFVDHAWLQTRAYRLSLPALWYVWCAGAYLAEVHHRGGRIIAKGGHALAIATMLFLAMTLSIMHRWSAPLTVPLSVFAWLFLFEWFLHLPITPVTEQRTWYRFLTLVGLCSYSMYLLHQPYLRNMQDALGAFASGPLTIPLKVIVPFLIIWAVSHVFYLYIEKPSIAFGARRRGRSTPVSDPTLAPLSATSDNPAAATGGHRPDGSAAS